MISSHKAVRLHGSSASTNAASRGLSAHRNFSWGAKHKIGHRNAGKVCKGFSTQDHTRAQKQLYRGTFWHDHYNPYARRYFPREWRLSSSWGKPGQDSTPRDKAEEKTEEDWYNRYQLRKRSQYDDFMRKMEEDPIGMLFGTRWAKWVDGVEAKASQASAFDAREEKSNSKTEKTIWESGYGPPVSHQRPTREKDMSSKKSQSATINVESLDQEFEIDPITNRKVQKMATTPNKTIKHDKSLVEGKAHVPTSGVNDPAQNSQQCFDMPVKCFVPSETSSSSVKEAKKVTGGPETASHSYKAPEMQAASGWLAQEGFGHKQERMAGDQPMAKIEDTKPRQVVSSKIESALDRHLQAHVSIARDLDRANLRYKPRENTQEDVDLLRPSDVRASAGLRGRPAKESDAAKQARRFILEDEFDSRSLRQDNQFAEEVANKERERLQVKDTSLERQPMLRSKTSVDRKEDQSKPKVPLSEWGNEISEAPGIMDTSKPIVQTMNNEKANKIKARIVPLKARLDAMKADYDALRKQWLDEKHKQEEKAAKTVKEMHEAEVNAQRVAMEAMENRVGGISSRSSIEGHGTGNVASSRSIPRLQSYLPGEGDMASNVHEFAGRDRWYKRKAPHANDETDAKLQRLANDRALIREVSDIYEEAYGTIDTNHRQSTLSEGSQVPIDTTTSSQVPKVSLFADSNDSHSSSTDISSPSKQAVGADPLIVIQRLYEALREAQNLVKGQRNCLQQISNPTTSQLLSISESPDMLAIIQTLFGELGKVQAVQQERRISEQAASSNESVSISETSKAYEQCLNEILKCTSKLSKIGQNLPSDMMSSGPKIPASTSPVSQDSKPPPNVSNVYRILAFDPAKQKVIASKATSLAPFSKEHPLLPVEALEILHNPGKFLPDLMFLLNKGFTVVSGTSNTLVFKKSETAQEIEEAEREETVKDISPIDLTGTEHNLSSTSNPMFTNEEIKAARNGRKARRESAPSISASSAPSEFAFQEPASAEPNTPPSSSSPSESNLPPSDKVRREEAVFSGPSRGNWQEAESKRAAKKNKRAAKRSKRVKNMLLTGTVTAACCYAVGVISQMMQH